jgi:hypothetical protein
LSTRCDSSYISNVKGVLREGTKWVVCPRDLLFFECLLFIIYIISEKLVTFSNVRKSIKIITIILLFIIILSNNVQESYPHNITLYNPSLGQSQTYAQATEGRSTQSDTPPSAPKTNSLISSYVSELRFLINPLISFLTKVISSL